MYDVIGDIHGHADALEALLHRLGYARRDGAHRHPGRQALFLGDFIDRGPQIRRALEIVRPMVEAGAARAVLGNHELNALAFHAPDPLAPGRHLRPQDAKHTAQYAETLRQLSAADLASHLAWFRTLPLWLALDGLRLVHACWDDGRMARISGPVDDDFLREACRPEGRLFEPVEAILKGKEVRLPAGMTFRDKDGNHRRRTRVKWYESPAGRTYRSYTFASEPIDCDDPLPAEVIRDAVPYPADAPPVFVGHYWLSGPRPERLRGNVACLDWSVARGGFLCGYRWDGEREVDDAKFVRV
ncbi:MAG: metallophosphoesterase [Planctomycetia bacterium]